AEDVDPAQVAPVAEVRRQHADDLVRLAVDAHDAAEDLGIAAEAVLPVAVADDEHAVVAEDLLLRPEVAAEQRPRAEGGEEVRRDAQALREFGRLAGLGEAEVEVAVGGDLAVARGLRFELEVVGRRDAAARMRAGVAEDALD